MMEKNEYFINGIENRIEQMIANLLDNSISFSKKGREYLCKCIKYRMIKKIVS